MPVPFENIQLKVDEFLKSNDVAEIAEVDYDLWQDHVFYGIDQGFTLEKNRGRLPFIEYEMDTDNYREAAHDGGSNVVSFRVRTNVGKTNKSTSKLEAQLLMKKIQIKFMRLLRRYFMTTANESDTNTEIINSTPWGFWQEFTMEIVDSYNKDDFGDDIG
jgi:hypothetical protein